MPPDARTRKSQIEFARATLEKCFGPSAADPRKARAPLRTIADSLPDPIDLKTVSDETLVSRKRVTTHDRAYQSLPGTYHVERRSVPGTSSDRDDPHTGSLPGHIATRETFQQRLQILEAERVEAEAIAQRMADLPPATPPKPEPRDTYTRFLGVASGIGIVGLAAAVHLGVATIPALAAFSVAAPLAMVAAGLALIAYTLAVARTKASDLREQEQQWISNVKALTENEFGETDHRFILAWLCGPGPGEASQATASAGDAFDAAFIERFLKACPYFPYFAAACLERVDELVSQGHDTHAMLRNLIRCAETCAHFDDEKFAAYSSFLDDRLAEGTGPIMMRADCTVPLHTPAIATDTVETLLLMNTYATHGEGFITVQRGLENRSDYRMHAGKAFAG